MYNEGSQVKISRKNIVFSVLVMHIKGRSNFVFDNSADPDEIPHKAAFHLGLHCLPK